MPHPLLYEINTRCWLNRLTGEAGRPVTLSDVPEHEFERWRRLGFTHIWLMGAWTAGPRSRSAALAHALNHCREILPDCEPGDIDGSPYAIAEYRVPNRLGGETGLQAFRQNLHAHGLKLLLDFVPNHVGLDHPWITSRPDWFVQSSRPEPGTFEQQTTAGTRWLAHGRDPHFPPWTDTAQLDYRNPALRLAMQSELLSVAARCDGVRCDMAMLILNDVFAQTWAAFPAPESSSPSDFWNEAITATRRVYPKFLFLAEVYWGLEARLRRSGFEYTYDKELYDALIRRDTAAVQQRLQNATPESLAAGARFLENHDEPRIASLLSPAEHQAAALLLLALPGMRLLHQGQLEGATVKMPVQLSRSPAVTPQPEIIGFYERMLLALPTTAVGRGHAVLIRPRPVGAGDSGANGCVLVQWTPAEPSEPGHREEMESHSFDLAAVNLADQPGAGYAPLTGPEVTRDAWRVRDLLGPAEWYECAAGSLREPGFRVDLPAHGAQLLHFERAPHGNH